MIPKVEELFAKAEAELDLASHDIKEGFVDLAMAHKAVADSLVHLVETIVHANEADFGGAEMTYSYEVRHNG